MIKRAYKFIFKIIKTYRNDGFIQALSLVQKSLLYHLNDRFHAAMILFKYYNCIIFKSKKFFIFQKKKYYYFYGIYNTAYDNERTVEIPIMLGFLEGHRDIEILEVGNVLSHYFAVKHDILDKYEVVNGVINQDVVVFQPPKKYSLIISISTLEHVGYDEEEDRDPNKILKAISNLKTLLLPNGEMIITLPFGQNLELDNLLEEEKIRFDKVYYLKRISSDNIWVETTRQDTQNTKYNSPFPGANAILVGIIKNA